MTEFPKEQALDRSVELQKKVMKRSTAARTMSNESACGDYDFFDPVIDAELDEVQQEAMRNGFVLEWHWDENKQDMVYTIEQMEPEDYAAFLAEEQEVVLEAMRVEVLEGTSSAMKVVRGYKTELDPTPEQYVLFCTCAGAARYAYNYGLARKKEAYKNGQPMPYANDLQRELTARKHADLPWLGKVSKWVVQNALRDLDTAYDNFFRKIALKKQGKHKGKCGYPKFKSKHKGRGSFRLDCPVHVFDGYVQLPKIGKVKLKEQGYIPTWGVKVLSATVSEQAGRWFVSVQVEEEHAEPIPATGPVIGVDLGIKSLATISDGRTIANPKALRSRLKALRRLSRRHSRKKKGGNNRKKAQRRLARMHARIANIRRDALHKATSSIVARTKPDGERPSVIVLEDLNISGMLKNRRLSRAIADVGLYEFRRQVEYKARFAGVQVKFVSRWYPSSKNCSGCGWYHEDLTLADRVFVCEQCGVVIDRDENAALNLAASA